MRGFWKIVRLEYTTMFRDWGALLILVGALVIYSALYGLIYAPEVVHNMPVAVVDKDNTPTSQKLISMLDATPQANVLYDVQTLEEGKELFLDHKVMGVLLIPEGFEKAALGGGQSHVSIYADGSYFLLYSSFLNAAANVVITESHNIQVRNFTMSGLEQSQAEDLAQPLSYKIETLHNPYNGYATALMPAVLIVILQQVILIGIGLLMGSQNEFKGWKPFENYSTIAITFAKLFTYFTLYIPLTFYLLWINYSFFGYPTKGVTSDEILFLLPYLLSVIFGAIALGGLLRKRESSIMYLAVFSVFFIMISGISWPRQGMNDIIYYIGKTLPSSSAIEGWVSLRTSGNTLLDVAPQWIMLWVLTLIYGAMAFWSVHYARNKK